MVLFDGRCFRHMGREIGSEIAQLSHAGAESCFGLGFSSPRDGQLAALKSWEIFDDRFQYVLPISNLASSVHPRQNGSLDPSVLTKASRCMRAMLSL